MPGVATSTSGRAPERGRQSWQQSTSTDLGQRLPWCCSQAPVSDSSQAFCACSFAGLLQSYDKRLWSLYLARNDSLMAGACPGTRTQQMANEFVRSGHLQDTLAPVQCCPSGATCYCVLSTVHLELRTTIVHIVAFVKNNTQHQSLLVATGACGPNNTRTEQSTCGCNSAA